MKLDSEFLKKNIFWVLLVVTAPLILIALIMIGPGTGSVIAEKTKKFDEALKQVKGMGSSVKTVGNVEYMKQQAAKSKQKETEVWKEAYLEQQDLMTWPVEFEKIYHFNDGYFAKEIKATRPKDGKTADLDPSPAPPASPDTYQLRTLKGVITQRTAEWILVKVTPPKKEDDGNKGDAKDKKAPPPSLPENAQIFRTEKIKITLNDGSGDKKVDLPDLQAGDRVEVVYDVGKYFGDRMTVLAGKTGEVAAFQKSYLSQIDPILQIVQPVNEKGEGVVELGDWLYSPDWLSNPDKAPKSHGFISFVPGEWKYSKDENYKEIWTAQEDLWVQKEIYRLVAQANDYVAEMQPGTNNKPKSGVFSNSYWDLSVKLEPSFVLVLRNRLPQTQVANVAFQITFKVAAKDEDGAALPDAKKTETYFLQGGSLTAGASSKEYKEFSPPEGAKEIVGVKQMLTWETAAVKRISQIVIGSGKRPTGSEGVGAPIPGGIKQPKQGSGPGSTIALSNRTFVKELMPFGKFKPKNAEPPPDAKGKPDAGGAKTAKGSPNGFDYNRYLDITPESRRLPVAVVLIVDQNQVDRVLTSFTNSKLRFLITQVLLNRYPNSINPKLGVDVAQQPGPGGPFPGPGPGGFKPWNPGGKLPPGMQPGPGMPGYKGPGSGPPQPGTPGTKGPGTGLPGTGFPITGNVEPPSEAATNVELVIYGNVTLYERFPARTTSAKDDED